MKQCKLMIALLLAVVGLFACAAASEPTVHTSGDFDYIVLEDGTAEITCYNGNAQTLTVPDKLGKYRVTSIGEYAISSCSSLTSITLPDGLVSIGGHAFFSCNSLTSITIPDSVTRMGANPFIACKKLTTINVSPRHPVLATIDGVLFDKTEKKLICYPCANVASAYTVPNGIRTIGEHAFYACDALWSITLPDTLTGIEDYAFYYCRTLTDITLPDGVMSIGTSAFSGCASLTSITIPDSVTQMGNNPFISCAKLASIHVNPSHPVLEIIDGVLFDKTEKRLITYPCTNSTTSYVVPDGTCIIGARAFQKCNSVVSVTLPDSVTSISAGAFAECESLASITLPDGVTSIPDEAFYSCKSLTSITLPGSVTSIGNFVFNGCSRQLVFTVPRDSWAEQWCIDNKKSYTFPDANDWLLN